MARVLIFGLGFSGAAIARAALAAGFAVAATSRDPAGLHAPAQVRVVRFEDAAAEIALASHIIATAPPGESGDPVLARFSAEIAASPVLRWAGYLSTTGVYGDRAGGWVDETSDVRAESPRAIRRIEAERDWAQFSGRLAVDLFRVAGIYGPGRSVFDDLRSGRARRVIKPGHAFGRIHRDDIAGAVVAAMRQSLPAGLRVLHLADDQPEESAVVTEHAALLLGLPVPPGIPHEQALPTMSEMARSFWADNRKVASRITQDVLGYRWQYPSYREGLASILAEERGEGGAQQREV